jgi:hypothetical protein
MIEDEEITAALQELAGTSVSPASVLSRIDRARVRRKRVHQAATLTSAGLAVTALFGGVAWLHDSTQAAGTLPGDVPSAISTPTPSTPAATNSAPVVRPTAATSTARDTLPPSPLRAFARAGYGIADADVLADLWRTGDPVLAKAIAGQTLLDGRSLSIKPGGQSTSTPHDYTKQLYLRFLNSGFDYTDAVNLAQIWKSNDAGAAKAVAGQMIIDGRLNEVKDALAHQKK